MKNNMNNYEVHIMMGLPGSGKTSWAKNNFKDSQIFYMDDKNILTDEEKFHNSFRWFCHWDAGVCIDTLILTNEALNMLINLICQRHPDHNVTRFIIHYWKENRELCLKNDEGRRDIGSGVTIRNAVFEYPKPNCIHFEIIEHEVYEKTTYEKLFAGTPNVLKSERWSLGGTWGNYRGDTGTIEPSDPKEFTEFDELLERICPDITFLQYKKLQKACVVYKTDYERDYYGGREEFGWWECDIKTLYDKLIELNVLS